LVSLAEKASAFLVVDCRIVIGIAELKEAIFTSALRQA